ncbi:unnamed protein product [Cyprideis torosa]|uniref:Uncharacterized protein n=1 Tax=Cyprideis torosa TaxID=163714 RepID=A0A7R8ZL43_9CRUS|nr:unnamed protein product [Cyprideis torosa]CAG0882835.1 unnamed protein product [Cyprideis torosa]
MPDDAPLPPLRHPSPRLKCSLCHPVMFLFLGAIICVWTSVLHAKPIVDPGVFVIQGVPTCGNGKGYCVLGNKCEVDDDFKLDLTGHCKGLQTAFSPAADFICCRENLPEYDLHPKKPKQQTSSDHTNSFVDLIFSDSVPWSPSPTSSSFLSKPEDDDNVELVEIVDVITDGSGVVDLITRPFTETQPQDYILKPTEAPSVNITWLQNYFQTIDSGGSSATRRPDAELTFNNIGREDPAVRGSTSGSVGTALHEAGIAAKVAEVTASGGYVVRRSRSDDQFKGSSNRHSKQRGGRASHRQGRLDKQWRTERTPKESSVDVVGIPLLHRIVNDPPPRPPVEKIKDPIQIYFPPETTPAPNYYIPPVQNEQQQTVDEQPGGADPSDVSAKIRGDDNVELDLETPDNEKRVNAVEVPSDSQAIEENQQENEDFDEELAEVLDRINEDSIEEAETSISSLGNSDESSPDLQQESTEHLSVVGTESEKETLSENTEGKETTGSVRQAAGTENVEVQIRPAEENKGLTPEAETQELKDEGISTSDADEFEEETVNENPVVNDDIAEDYEPDFQGSSEGISDEVIQDNSKEDEKEEKEVEKSEERRPEADNDIVKATQGGNDAHHLQQINDIVKIAQETEGDLQSSSNDAGEANSLSSDVDLAEGSSSKVEKVAQESDGNPQSDEDFLETVPDFPNNQQELSLFDDTEESVEQQELQHIGIEESQDLEHPQQVDERKSSSVSELQEASIAEEEDTTQQQKKTSDEPQGTEEEDGSSKDDSSSEEKQDTNLQQQDAVTQQTEGAEKEDVSSEEGADAVQHDEEADAVQHNEEEVDAVQHDSTHVAVEDSTDSEGDTSTENEKDQKLKESSAEKGGSADEARSATTEQQNLTDQESTDVKLQTGAGQGDEQESKTSTEKDQGNSLGEEKRSTEQSSSTEPSEGVSVEASEFTTVQQLQIISEQVSDEAGESNVQNILAEEVEEQFVKQKENGQVEQVGQGDTENESIQESSTEEVGMGQITGAGDGKEETEEDGSDKTKEHVTESEGQTLHQSLEFQSTNHDNITQDGSGESVGDSIQHNSGSPQEAVLESPVPLQDTSNGANGKTPVESEFHYYDAITTEKSTTTNYEYSTMVPIESMIQPQECGISGKNHGHQFNRRRLQQSPEVPLPFFFRGLHGRYLGVVSGQVTSTVVWCWMAAFVEKNPNGNDKFLCTGALIEQDLVVSTASCLKKLFERGLQNFRVILGDSNLKLDLDVNDNFGVQYRFGKVKTQRIAKLEQPITLSMTVCLLCLPMEGKDFSDSICTVTGYSKPILTEQEKQNPYLNDLTEGVLRQASFPVMPGESCEETVTGRRRKFSRSQDLEEESPEAKPYKYHKEAPPKESSSSNEPLYNILCTGGPAGEKACIETLDSGSPLACNINGQYYLAGILSSNVGCSEEALPSIYTNIARYLRWLRINYMRMLGFIID